MAKVLPEEKLGETWKGLLAQMGRLRFVDEGRVSGLWFKPVDQAIPKEGAGGPGPGPAFPSASPWLEL